tara:strand:- start:86 stop:628 length:543 start_codon:yes stop_codon:yes gene_type:complete
VPQLTELTVILSNLVTFSRLLRNPTTKQEMADLNRQPSVAFVGYPVSQAADILMMRPQYVPVGPDQRPQIELAREIAQRFNSQFGDLFPVPGGVYGEQSRGTDGGSKMSTSLGNAINLCDYPETIERKVDAMQTDSARVQRNDPGRSERCPVHRFHQGIGTDSLNQIEEGCRSGALGCVD